MAHIKIEIINRSTVLTDAAVSAAVPALQTQIHDHFAPAWGIDADLKFIPSNKKASPSAWWLLILDSSDQAGALGYHDITAKGLPLGKVFAATDLKFGNSWTVTASHELLEMLGDPEINLTVFVQNSNTSGRLYAYENADAVEDDSLGYMIGSTLVSDFVFPSWFEESSPAGTQFDYEKKVTKPFELLPGGYIGYFDVGTGNGWQQLTAQKAAPNAQGKPDFRLLARPKVGLRRERRRLPRDLWLNSSAKG